MTMFPQYIVKKPPPETVSSMDEEDSGRGISYDMASSHGGTAAATAAASGTAAAGAIPEAAEGNGRGL